MSWQSGSTAQYTAEMNTSVNPPYYPPSNDVSFLPVSTHPGMSVLQFFLSTHLTGYTRGWGTFFEVLVAIKTTQMCVKNVPSTKFGTS